MRDERAEEPEKTGASVAISRVAIPTRHAAAKLLGKIRSD